MNYFKNIKNSFKIKHYVNYIAVTVVFAVMLALYFAGALNKSLPLLLIR